ncbi:MAG: hypothetical protein K0Q89_2743 [Thermomicrobiales bacterium]|nr:hypothetical protein [Thermomicrobiales bacterium]
MPVNRYRYRRAAADVALHRRRSGGSLSGPTPALGLGCGAVKVTPLKAVRVVRVGAIDNLVAIEDAITVVVGITRAGLVDVVLVAIRRAVVVRIDIKRIGAQLELDRILEPVPVAIERIGRRGRRRLGTLFRGRGFRLDDWCFLRDSGGIGRRGDVCWCGFLRRLALGDRHQRGDAARPLDLARSGCVAGNGWIDQEDARGVEQEDPWHVVDQQLTRLLVVRQAFRRIDGHVTKLGQLVELLVAVAEGIETGLTGPEDADPVLRVGVVLVPAAEVDQLRMRRRILAQGRERGPLHRFDGELHAQNVADFSGNRRC